MTLTRKAAPETGPEPEAASATGPIKTVSPVPVLALGNVGDAGPGSSLPVGDSLQTQFPTTKLHFKSPRNHPDPDALGAEVNEDDISTAMRPFKSPRNHLHDTPGQLSPHKALANAFAQETSRRIQQAFTQARALCMNATRAGARLTLTRNRVREAPSFILYWQSSA